MSVQKKRLVVIGNGMAGVRAVEELLVLAPDLYEIHIIGAEPHPNYNRIMLSPVLAGEQTLSDIVLNDWAWYEDNHITLHTGVTITQIKRKQQMLCSKDGDFLAYDKLLLATGSLPFMPPIPGIKGKGVLAYRDIADTEAMIAAASKHQQAVVIGGGLLGLEAANGLCKRGMKVSVVHLAGHLMERQLDVQAATLLQTDLGKRGMAFYTGTSASEIRVNADNEVTAVVLKDGSVLPAQLVVVAAGIKPNTVLAEAAGLYCARGVVVNDTMQTYDPKIYAVGECVSHRGVAYGLVAPLFEQAKVAANHLAEMGIGRYQGSQTSTKLKVAGIDLFSAGDFVGTEASERIVLSDPASGVYKKLLIEKDKLIGAVMYGDTANGAWYFKLLKEGKDIREIRDQLMFGESNIGDSGHQGNMSAATMDDQAEVCGCNGVCKGAIVTAINQKGLFTLDEVRKHTKASSSCGSCTGLVEQILASTLGGAYSAESKADKAMCSCSPHSHAVVRKAVKEHKLLSAFAVMQFMEWQTPQGCSKCRPALNYYCLSTWPLEATDDPQSRFINERAHGNIQKDGTFSVIPRMWGGETTAAELRRIADVVDKFKIPTVKVTGGQRIDLLGVKKEDLPAVWADLGMPSGHAYAKALRTVKTCVGSEWCRFGTQNSTQLGKDLERLYFGMYAPHKVKLAVSGCPRNCAESGIKDVGIIGVDSGWEIMIGGNGGIKTEVAQFLVKVSTDQEAKDIASAFLQLYREEGWYLERTVHYLARVGMSYIKKQVVDDAHTRAALIARLHLALHNAPDPWLMQPASMVDKKQFTTIMLKEIA